MDTNDGAGGSFVIDEKTGERVLVERTKEKAEPAQAPAHKPKKSKE